jgi:DNA-binding XRE family transcriptional regulator
MEPEQFREWRARMRLSQAAAAEALGLGRTTVQAYEHGRRRDAIAFAGIPLVVELACEALERRERKR